MTVPPIRSQQDGRGSETIADLGDRLLDGVLHGDDELRLAHLDELRVVHPGRERGRAGDGEG